MQMQKQPCSMPVGVSFAAVPEQKILIGPHSLKIFLSSPHVNSILINLSCLKNVLYFFQTSPYPVMMPHSQPVYVPQSPYTYQSPVSIIMLAAWFIVLGLCKKLA